MALCGFNEKMLKALRNFLDGAIEYGIIERAKNKGISIEKQFKNEYNEISQWNYYSRKIIDKPTQKQVEGIGLLVGGTFEKDQLRGVSNYALAHTSDAELLKDLDDHYYGDLKGDVRNMSKLFDWVNENLGKYKI